MLLAMDSQFKREDYFFPPGQGDFWVLGHVLLPKFCAHSH